MKKVNLKRIRSAMLALTLAWAVSGYGSSSAMTSEADLENLSTLPERTSLTGERAFVFSPQLMEWAAYDKDGYRVASGKANGGADFCPDLGEPCRTPEGTFRIFRQEGADCESSQFPIAENGGAPMPYCMFFKGGAAIHGSPYLAKENNSHGCIRVKTDAARWLQEYFIQTGTKVIILPYQNEQLS